MVLYRVKMRDLRNVFPSLDVYHKPQAVKQKMRPTGAREGLLFGHTLGVLLVVKPLERFQKVSRRGSKQQRREGLFGVARLAVWG